MFSLHISIYHCYIKPFDVNELPSSKTLAQHISQYKAYSPDVGNGAGSAVLYNVKL